MRRLIQAMLLLCLATPLMAQSGYIVVAPMVTPMMDGSALVRVDGDSAGVLMQRELTLTVPVGLRQVSIERPGYLPFRSTVTVKDGDVAQVSPELEPAVRRINDEYGNTKARPGTLRVRVVHLEPVNVAVGAYGLSLGPTPATVELPAGENRIMVGETEVCFRGAAGVPVLLRLRTGKVEELRAAESCGVRIPAEENMAEGGPVFTPYTRKPDLLNRDEVGRALVANYPVLLRDAGIGGTVLAWVLVNDDGRVLRTDIKESSGHNELDEAALHVIRVMRFSPADNRGTPVKVWIQLPVVFRTQ